MVLLDNGTLGSGTWNTWVRNMVKDCRLIRADPSCKLMLKVTGEAVVVFHSSGQNYAHVVDVQLDY